MPAIMLTKVLPGRRVEIETPDYAEGQTVEVSVRPVTAENPNDLPFDEWKKRFDAWVNMPRPNYPVLAPEAMQRASFYEDDE